MNVYLLSMAFCLVFLSVAIELIRRRKLQERYALLWLALGIPMAGFSLFPHLLESISGLLHISYAPSLLFLIGILFSLAFIMHITTVISRLQQKVTRLVQEVALLQMRLQDEGEKEA